MRQLQPLHPSSFCLQLLLHSIVNTKRQSSASCQRFFGNLFFGLPAVQETTGARADTIKFVSPAPGYEIEIHELENVLALLEKFALLLGLNKSAAKSLQLQFSNTGALTLAHDGAATGASRAM